MEPTTNLDLTEELHHKTCVLKSPDKLNAIRNKDGWWINSSVFSEEAAHFKKYGYYTEAPWGSPDWVDYWEEQLRRCKDGYEVGGSRITGDHYFYLNYCQLYRSTELKSGRAARKGLDFPDFWDYDYNYFHILNIARDGIEKADLKALNLEVQPKWLDGGHHVIVGKKRRAGYSYKNAALAVNTYNHTRNSTTIIGAYLKEYLFPEGTIGMTSKYLDFLTEHTGWGKKREGVDKQFHKKASYLEEINGMFIEKGYQSSLLGITFKDNPDAFRGKDAQKILIEEAGKAPNLKDTVLATLPTLDDGAYVTGQIVVFGTSGDLESASADFAEMFYDPESYNMLPFENIWDEKAIPGSTCGFFVPTTVATVGFMDPNGNSLRKDNLEFELDQRAKLAKGAGGTYALKKRMLEYPITPAEAFSIGGLNDFPTEELKEQLDKVTINKLHSKFGTVCKIRRDPDGAKLIPDLANELVPVRDIPPDPQHMAGAIVVYEFPVANPPPGLYKAGYDPYRQDLSQGPSLGSIFIYKASNQFSFTRDMIVAEYIGRPKTTDDYNYIVEMLAELYNVEVMHENEVPEVKAYFQRRKKLHLLARQPDSVIKANVKSSKVNRVFGIHMNAQLKEAGEKYIKQWLLEERDIDEDGNVILNLHTIHSPVLLKQLISYNRKKGNFDAVMAFMMVMFQLQDEALGTEHKETNVSNALNQLAEHMTSKYK